MKNLLFLLPFIVLLTNCKNDPCEGIKCTNGGNCVNGECICPEQWTGPDCSLQKKPTSVNIKKIIINSFPPTDTNGGGWDITSGADLYVTIWKDNEQLYTSNYYENASPNLPNQFIISPPEKITSVTESHVIALYDYDDFDADDLIDALSFTPYNENNLFPETLTGTIGNTSITLEIDYSF